MKEEKRENLMKLIKPQVSSVRLAEELEITQKTAWMMMDKFKNGNFEYLRKVL